MSTETRVRDHFHLDAHRFDAIYEEGKNPLDRFIDHVWRGVVRRRFDITLDKLEPVRGQSVLDVGCGSGRYGLALAARGARRILGVDFAPAMIDLARQLAEKAGVSQACEFRVGAFPADVANERFDAAIALGFFDYVPNPADLVRAMRECTTGKLVMSFPKAWEWRVPIRRLRFLAAGCPLFLYSGAQVKKVLADAGVTRYECIELDRDYLIIAQV
jgi:2-polyprenyl-3-methyl-5-hydroxy-6-metoxy-1,4-benzoquinol methylase